MTIDILVVDDSAFFRRVVRDILGSEEGIRIVGEAKNGREAIERTEALRPDLVTMDVEMPVMSGVEAVRRIMERVPTNILMMSAQTFDGSQATLDALAAGAVDFIYKDSVVPGKGFSHRLHEKIRQIHLHARSRSVPGPVVDGGADAMVGGTRRGARARRSSRFSVLAIGASTGGPAALQRLIPALPNDFPIPVVVVQHMPEGFSESFAQRLSRLSRLDVRQARPGDVLEAGTVLVAPGGRQMSLEKGTGRGTVHIRAPRDDEIFRPSIDLALSTLAIQGGGPVLALILTGMGADGCEGGREVKRRGGVVWSQDEASSVIFGMPRAVMEAGISDAVLSLDELVDKFSMKDCAWIS